jgi:hypothetical protein
VNAQGLYVGKSGNVFKVKEKEKLVQEVRIGETCQVNLFGSIQLSTQAIQALCEAEVPIDYFSMGGWFYGVTHGLGVRNIYLRRDQFRLADVPSFCRGSRPGRTADSCSYHSPSHGKEFQARSLLRSGRVDTVRIKTDLASEGAALSSLMPSKGHRLASAQRDSRSQGVHAIAA